MLDAAREFAESVVRPALDDWESGRAIPPPALRRAGELGLCRLTVPADLGGHGLAARESAAVFGALAETCFATAVALGVHNNVTALIAAHGTPAQRERALPDLMSGARVGAFLVTEPGGGSDPAGMRSRARRTATGLRLDGAKAWIANATFARDLCVFARIEDPDGSGGIGCVLVDAQAGGVVVEPAYNLLAGHALGTAGVRFGAVELAPDALLVPAGRGLQAALAGIDRARVHVAAMCCGILRSGIDFALAHAAGRTAFDRPILDHQAPQWLLAEAATDLAAAELLVDEAARRIECGDAPGPAAAHAKKFASRAAFTRLSDCMQVMGADGFSADYPLARHLAGAKMSHYLDGTTEIQNIVIARDLRRHGVRRGAAAPPGR